jgi:hypothetical protein
VAKDKLSAAQRYDEQSAKQQARLVGMHDSNTQRFERLRADADAAYQALKNDAYN